MAKVEIYTRGMCGYCSRAKALLSKLGVAYTEINAGMNADARAEMQKRAGGANTFPQIFINGQHIGGCDDLMQLNQTGRLKALLETGNPKGGSSAPKKA